MFAFWVVAGLISAAAAFLVLHTAVRAAVNAGSEDPTLALYRRQLGEIDDLADRGLIVETERKGAHAEAARRLLAAADTEVAPWRVDAGMRRILLLVAGLAPIVAVALYLGVGSPGYPDQGFNARLAGWRAAEPSSLSPPEMAAVLQALTLERPKDPEAFRYLALAQAASDNPSAAARALRRAITLSPRQADLWELLGQALLAQSGGDGTPESTRAFAEAVKLDPSIVNARFYLGQAKVTGGDKAGGLAAWRALQAELPAADPRRGALSQAIAEAERGPSPAAPLAGQMGAIRGMVEGLATRLEADPGDPEGWIRLVRSYAVLGETVKRDAALAQARKRFAADPDVLKALDLAAKTEHMR